MYGTPKFMYAHVQNIDENACRAYSGVFCVQFQLVPSETRWSRPHPINSSITVTNNLIFHVPHIRNRFNYVLSQQTQQQQNGPRWSMSRSKAHELQSIQVSGVMQYSFCFATRSPFMLFVVVFVRRGRALAHFVAFVVSFFLVIALGYKLLINQ